MFHQMATLGLIWSSMRKARSRSSGYTLSTGTPAAMTASGSVKDGKSLRQRFPGNFCTFQKSAQVASGGVPFFHAVPVEK